MLRFFKKASAGFSLLEILIGLTLVGIGVSAIAAYLGRYFQDDRFMAMRGAKSRIIWQMEEAISDPVAVASSLEVLTGPNALNSTAFMRCLSDDTLCPSEYTDPQKMNRLDFYVADDVGGRRRLSEFWSREGAPDCLPPRADSCPFNVDVFFWFSCSSGLAESCARPPIVNLLFQITPTEPTTQNGKGFNYYHPGNSPVIDRPEEVAIRIPVREIATASQECRSDQYVDGFDVRGRVVCKCTSRKTRKNAAGATMYDAMQRPLCQDNRCPDNMILIGFEAGENAEWNPTCVSPNSNQCYTVNMTDGVECAEGYWVASINLGTCAISPISGKKGVSGYTISCAGQPAKCCTGHY